MVLGKDKRATQFDMLQAQAHFSSPATAPEKQSDGAPQPQSDSKTLYKRESSPATEHDGPRKILRGSPKPLQLPTIVESGELAQAPFVRNGSPWDDYKTIFTCDLAGTVSISEHRHRASKVVAIRTSAAENAEEMLRRYTQFNHINIISAKECFKDNGVNHFIVDDLPVSLEHLVASDAYPTEVQLASILKQILDGLSYLLKCGYQHSSLKCSTVLMGLDGAVKIAGLDLIVTYAPGKPQSLSLRGIGCLTMELMQKYSKENVGIDDTTRWPIDSNAVGFLSSTTSARSISDLSQHPLLKSRLPSTGSLVGLARLAIVSTCTFYSYKP